MYDCCSLILHLLFDTSLGLFGFPRNHFLILTKMEMDAQNLSMQTNITFADDSINKHVHAVVLMLCGCYGTI